MANKKFEVRLVSWGMYTEWDSSSKALPKILKVTKDIPCQIDVEFGYIVNIKKAKNKKLHYCIFHPNIPDEAGNPMPSFSGEEYVKQNDWNFFIGDTIWHPAENKEGDWRITLTLEGQVIADETFNLYPLSLL